jgi:putative ABC transport system permease protein
MQTLEAATALFCTEALRAIARNKLRSALAGLAIMIGIAAVVCVVAIGRAGSRRAEEQLQSLGDNFVWVEAGSRAPSGVRTGTHGTTSLTLEDADAILREVPLMKRLTPNVDGKSSSASGTGARTTAAWVRTTSRSSAGSWPAARRTRRRTCGALPASA